MKNLFRTKTFWAGIGAIATGVGLILAGNVPEGVNSIATGVMAILLRDGIRTAGATR
jgi:hypothetical protein